MANFILIFVCFFGGYALTKWRVFPENGYHTLNRFVIFVSLPAVILLQIHNIHLDQSVLLPISMPWIQFLTGLVLFYFLGKMFGWSKETLGALVLTCSLGNTSFVGFPMLEAFYGPQSLSVGIMIDQMGSFLITGTLGVGLAAFLSGKSVSLKDLLLRIIKFPPFIALVVAFALHDISYNQVTEQVLQRLGSTMIPLSLFSVGAQIDFHMDNIKQNSILIILGLVFKLIFVPLICLFIYRYILNLNDEATLITLTESAMPPMVVAGILVQEFSLNYRLGNMLLGIGISLSLITVPLWVFIFKYCGLH